MPEIYLDSFQHTALVAFDIALDLGARIMKMVAV
jgi:hypothetical protein